MKDGKGLAELRIGEFTSEYFERVYYYCLKKTGSETEAAELSQDIALGIIEQLRRGACPDSFSGWVWQIVRNIYAGWATEKHKTRERLSDTDISEFEIPDNSDFVSDIIREDDIATVRREMAFILSEYRNVLLMYYVQNRRVCDIAKNLGIPEGTVKTRLFRARQKLKEGMYMAREFGKRSYDPEEISFRLNGSHGSFDPYQATKRKIPKNILLEASNNPSTIEELAIELGIAVPYMEEEVSILEEGELLKKVDGNKYLTNFFISPRECQEEIDELCYRFAERNYVALWTLAGKATEKAKEVGALNGTLAKEDAQMYFVGNVGFRIYLTPFTNHILVGHFKRKDGTNWGFAGNEAGARLRESAGISNTFCSADGIYFGGYYINGAGFIKNHYKDIDATSFEGKTQMLKMLSESGGDVSEFSENDLRVANELISCGLAVRTDDGKVIPRVIMIHGTMNEIMQPIWADSENARMKDEMRKLTRDVEGVIARYCTDYLKDDFEYYVAQSINVLGHCVKLIKDKGLYTGNYRDFLAMIY